MSSTTKSWYVQGGFGTLLGPMPDDALEQMARTGALLPDDLIREASSIEWLSAADIAGLFDPSVSFTGKSDAAVEPQEITGVALARPANANADQPPLENVSETQSSTASPTANSTSRPTKKTKTTSRPTTSAADSEEELLAEIFLLNSPVERIDANVSELSLATSEIEKPPSPVRPFANQSDPLSQAATSMPDQSAAAAPFQATAATPYARPSSPKSYREPLLVRCREWFAGLPDRLAISLDRRAILAIIVLALGGWYFFPVMEKKPEPTVQLANVEGVVLLDGKPVSEVLVVFKPNKKQGSIGPPSAGRTDAQGHFKLAINGTRRGAVVGSHQVMIMTKGSNAMSSGAAPGIPSSGSVPGSYSQPDTTPLVAEVLPDRDNQISLKLSSKMKPEKPQ